MKKELLFYIGFAALSLALAYWASVPKSGGTSLDSWIAINPELVSEVKWQHGSETATFVRNPQGQFWGNVSDSGQTGAATNFLANESFSEFLTNLNPLQVIRAFQVESEKLPQYGIDASSPTLVVRYGSDAFELKIGKKQFGVANRYAWDQGRERVLLLSSDDIDRFEKANSQFFEAKLMMDNFVEAEHVVISGKGTQVSLSRSGVVNDSGPVWASSTDESKTKSGAQSWFSRIERLRIEEYAPDSKFSNDEAILELQLELPRSKKTTVRFFARAKDDQSQEYFVWTSDIKTFGKVNSGRVENIMKDLNSILD